jgi:prepilin-type N-terminal cleavage/methylation domain-containing protein
MPCSRQQPTVGRGFSLLELLIVVTIMALVAGVAVPRFAASIQRQRADAAARRVAADLNMAQSRANTTSTTVTVTFTFASSQYQVSGVADLAQPLNTYTVKLPNDPYGATLVSTTFGGGAPVSSGTSQISYGGYGVPAAGGSVVVAVGSAARVIVVDANSGLATVQ